MAVFITAGVVVAFVAVLAIWGLWRRQLRLEAKLDTDTETREQLEQARADIRELSAQADARDADLQELRPRKRPSYWVIRGGAVAVPLVILGGLALSNDAKAVLRRPCPMPEAQALPLPPPRPAPVVVPPAPQRVSAPQERGYGGPERTRPAPGPPPSLAPQVRPPASVPPTTQPRRPPATVPPPVVYESPPARSESTLLVEIEVPTVPVVVMDVLEVVL